MEIRAAIRADAGALGAVMVTSWLAAHEGQMPDAAWQKRKAEWTPDVSARGWAGVLDANAPRELLLVAEDDSAVLNALAYAIPDDEEPAGSMARLSAIYVSPDHCGQGIGTALLTSVAKHLVELGFASLCVDVLTVNLRARRFYEAMGALEVGYGTFDEEGHELRVTTYEWSELDDLIGNL